MNHYSNFQAQLFTFHPPITESAKQADHSVENPHRPSTMMNECNSFIKECNKIAAFDLKITLSYIAIIMQIHLYIMFYIHYNSLLDIHQFINPVWENLNKI